MYVQMSAAFCTFKSWVEERLSGDSLQYERARQQFQPLADAGEEHDHTDPNPL